MNEQEYKAARGELERLEAARRDHPEDAQKIDETIESLRADMEAFEQGARATGKPPGGHGQ